MIKINAQRDHSSSRGSRNYWMQMFNWSSSTDTHKLPWVMNRYRDRNGPQRRLAKRHGELLLRSQPLWSAHGDFFFLLHSLEINILTTINPRGIAEGNVVELFTLELLNLIVNSWEMTVSWNDSYLCLRRSKHIWVWNLFFVLLLCINGRVKNTQGISEG